MVRHLSKSKLMAGLQCPRRLWLDVNRPGLAEPSADTAAAFAAGHQVGELARSLYGGDSGHLVAGHDRLDRALAETRQLLKDREKRPLFEATLRAAGVLVRLDVLKPSDGGWTLVEVKASTTLKPEHVSDAAIQGWVVRKAGLTLDRVLLAHVDNRFVYPGGGDYRGLLVEEDITHEVEALAAVVPTWIAEARGALAGEEPEIRPGKRCFQPYPCGYTGHCWQGGTAFPLLGLGGDREFLGGLLAEGYRDVREIPPDRLRSATQIRIAGIVRQGTPVLEAGAARAVRALAYPRYFLDFETYASAIPVFAGTRPYEPVPFQFSCHRQMADGSLEHFGFLDPGGPEARDPSRAFAQALIAAAGDEGPVVVYTNYEAGVLSKLAARLPDLALPLERILARLVDLHPVTKAHYYHPDLQGSWSLKALLPVIAPDLSYSSAGDVQDGSAAQAAYAELLAAGTTAGRRAALVASLERYCALDTLALVRLAGFLAG